MLFSEGVNVYAAINTARVVRFDRMAWYQSVMMMSFRERVEVRNGSLFDEASVVKSRDLPGWWPLGCRNTIRRSSGNR